MLELKPGMTVADIGAGGAAAPSNLPAACCDAIFLRHVYHHITDIELFNRSLHTSLKAGGRLAIIDFVPRTGSQVPDGVPASREDMALHRQW